MLIDLQVGQVLLLNYLLTPYTGCPVKKIDVLLEFNWGTFYFLVFFVLRAHRVMIPSHFIQCASNLYFCQRVSVRAKCEKPPI